MRARRQRGGVAAVAVCLGSESRIRWLIDGGLAGETLAGGRWVHDFGDPGEHTLTALGASGGWSRVRHRVLRWRSVELRQQVFG